MGKQHLVSFALYHENLGSVWRWIMSIKNPLPRHRQDYRVHLRSVSADLPMEIERLQGVHPIRGVA
ncbi:hypothetical protein KSB_02280 [Ktedonobacter robiniae]|uniref:Uncharacterized protein n=1 Tax=Ktedonobacter robiniae TaxID=2778365 RepID=A0ABQ3UGD6_9CHLR|nr:hypothetical protein KSB_02280 [Ktedonobacter robiniae]